MLREDEEEEKKTKQDQFPLISFTYRQIKHVNNENIFFLLLYDFIVTYTRCLTMKMRWLIVIRVCRKRRQAYFLLNLMRWLHFPIDFFSYLNDIFTLVMLIRNSRNIIEIFQLKKNRLFIWSLNWMFVSAFYINQITKTHSLDSVSRMMMQLVLLTDNIYIYKQNPMRFIKHRSMSRRKA